MSTRVPLLVTFVVAMAWRLFILYQWPTAYSFDGYQRWAGRDHVLVQDWLPATQSIIWAVAQLGGGIHAGRIVMSMVAALAAVMGGVLAQHFARQRWGEHGAAVAGWAMAVAGVFGPWGSWGTVFYQESTFLLVLFSGLALALKGHLRAADLVVGLLGLVRYEGWPCILLYIAWRRQIGAGVALWGIATWLAIRGLGIEGYHASPVNFADWEGLGERFDWKAYRHDLGNLLYRVAMSGSLFWTVLAGLGLWLTRGLRGPGLLALVYLSQVAATLAWLAGLEVSTSRMLVIPTGLALVLGTTAVAYLESKVPRVLVPVALAITLAVHVSDGGRRAKVEGGRVVKERGAVALMEDCPGCTWWVLPRRKMGTRERHDGCEVIQGITDMRHGDEFYCAPWVEPENAMSLYSSCSGTIRWDGGKREYVMERHLPGGTTAPPDMPADDPSTGGGDGGED